MKVADLEVGQTLVNATRTKTLGITAIVPWSGGSGEVHFVEQSSRGTRRREMTFAQFERMTSFVVATSPPICGARPRGGDGSAWCTLPIGHKGLHECNQDGDGPTLTFRRWTKMGEGKPVRAVAAASDYACVVCEVKIADRRLLCDACLAGYEDTDGGDMLTVVAWAADRARQTFLERHRPLVERLAGRMPSLRALLLVHGIASIGGDQPLIVEVDQIARIFGVAGTRARRRRQNVGA